MKFWEDLKSRGIVGRACLIATIATAALAATGAPAQAAQRNQAAYKVAMAAYKNMLSIKKSTVQSDATNYYSSIQSCWSSWMNTVVTEYNNSTLPSGADPFQALFSIYMEASMVVQLQAEKPFDNQLRALVNTQLKRHQLNAVNAARAKRMLALDAQLYNVHLCSDANNWLAAGLTDSEDPDFEQKAETMENKLGTVAYNPILMLSSSEKLNLELIQDRVQNHENNLVDQVIKPLITELAQTESGYYNELGQSS